MPEITHWIVEVCVAPGERRIITMCPASSAGEAFDVARQYHGNRYSHYMAMPNYVMTGKINPVVWEDDRAA